MTEITPSPPKRRIIENKQQPDRFSFAPSVYRNVMFDMLGNKSLAAFLEASKGSNVLKSEKWAERKQEWKEMMQEIDDLAEQDFESNWEKIMVIVLTAPTESPKLFEQFVEMFKEYGIEFQQDLWEKPSRYIYPVEVFLAKSETFRDLAGFKEWKVLIDRVADKIKYVDQHGHEEEDPHDLILTLAGQLQTLFENMTYSAKITQTEILDLFVSNLDVVFINDAVPNIFENFGYFKNQRVQTWIKNHLREFQELYAEIESGKTTFPADQVEETLSLLQQDMQNLKRYLE